MAMDFPKNLIIIAINLKRKRNEDKKKQSPFYYFSCISIRVLYLNVDNLL